MLNIFSSLSGGGDVVSLSEASIHEDSGGDNLSETTSEKNIDVENVDKSIDDYKNRLCRNEDLVHHSLWSR